ncbi:helix-turn-helix domain-containing protein [Rhodanobacter geophilus]|uniref:Helix-turn-helix domain-containing protein n=1 Tax=Rhodanobacter geophilus TaxID=3162488 RepID=A0ABV3QMZ8_9GAMM
MALARKSAKQLGIKSVYRAENPVFLATLRAFRERANLTQDELAALLQRPQSFITSAERGTVRLDGLQIHDWVHACGGDLVHWAKEIEQALGTPAKGRTKARR